MHTIFHLDLDAFFVSVERILNPSLNGKPVIVGADPKSGRGVVSACSYEARKFGLHSAMPISKAFKLCPHGIYLHGHYEKYEYYSDKVREYLETLAPEIEQASIDEFYMNFTGCKIIYSSYIELAAKMQKEIFLYYKLPCSIGIAGNKTVAKIASDCFKPQGITYIQTGMEKEFLSEMPVEVIPGVGKSTLINLHKNNIYLIKDILKLPGNYLYKKFGKYGIDLYKKAQGKGKETLTLEHSRKSISKEHTFHEDINDVVIVKKYLFQLTEKISQTLRNYNWKSGTVTVKLRYSDFSTITRAKTIHPTSDDKVIYNIAINLFESAYVNNRNIRLIGVGLTNFTENEEQELIFDQNKIKREKMFNAVDNLRNKFGFSSIKIGQE